MKRVRYTSAQKNKPMVIYTEMSGLPRIDYTSKRMVRKKEVMIFPSREERLRFLEKNPLQSFEEEMGEKLPASAEGIVTAVFSYVGLEVYLNVQLASKVAERVRQIDGKVMRDSKVFESYQYYLKDGKVTKLLSDLGEVSDRCAAEAASKLAAFLDMDEPSFEGVFMVEVSKNKTRPYRCYKSGDNKEILIDLTNGNLFVVDREKMKRTSVGEKFSFGSINFRREEFSKSYKRD